MTYWKESDVKNEWVFYDEHGAAIAKVTSFGMPSGDPRLNNVLIEGHTTQASVRATMLHTGKGSAQYRTAVLPTQKTISLRDPVTASKTQNATKQGQKATGVSVAVTGATLQTKPVYWYVALGILPELYPEVTAFLKARGIPQTVKHPDYQIPVKIVYSYEINTTSILRASDYAPIDSYLGKPKPPKAYPERQIRLDVYPDEANKINIYAKSERGREMEEYAEDLTEYYKANAVYLSEIAEQEKKKPLGQTTAEPISVNPTPASELIKRKQSIAAGNTAIQAGKGISGAISAGNRLIAQDKDKEDNKLPEAQPLSVKPNLVDQVVDAIKNYGLYLLIAWFFFSKK